MEKKKAVHSIAISRNKIKSFFIGRVAGLCRYLFLISFSFVVLYPFIYLIVNSFKGATDFADPVVQWVPKELYLGNFRSAAVVFDLWESIGNTLMYEIVAAMLQFCACAVAGYGLARFEFRGKKILTAVMILNILVPSMMIITPSYVNFSRMDFLGILKGISGLIGDDIRPNLLNTQLVFYLPSVLGVGLKGGFFIYIYMQFYKKLPKELEEAAAIDGAGPWKTFLRIAVPNSITAAVTVLLFSIVWHWNDFYLAQMYNSKHPTLSVALNSFSENVISSKLAIDTALSKALSVPILLTGCLLFIIPLIAFYAIIQKKFIASVTNSGITG